MSLSVYLLQDIYIAVCSIIWIYMYEQSRRLYEQLSNTLNELWYIEILYHGHCIQSSIVELIKLFRDRNEKLIIIPTVRKERLGILMLPWLVHLFTLMILPVI